MATGLAVSRLINVSINLFAAGAAFANLNSLLIMGDSDVIDTRTRIKSYSSIGGVAADFGTSAPEYNAAALFFAQQPQPNQLYIGRWARTAVSGRLFGAPLTAAQQLLANFTAVTSGGFKIGVDGNAVVNVSGINLSSAANLNNVASLIQTALTTATVAATVTWNGSQFVFKSNSTGATSTVAPLQAPTSGVDLSPLLLANAAANPVQVNGIAAETALQAVSILDQSQTYWYALSFAYSALADADTLAVAQFIEASGNHVFGVTTAASNVIDPSSSADIASSLKALGYNRTIVQYSTIPYAIVSALGRALTTDFNLNNSVITLMFKQEPGVSPEVLTLTQANTLDAKRANYFVNYNNGTAIFENGVMAGSAYFDEIFGTDWLKNAIQTNVYNLLYSTPTKIPQTDAGNHQIATVIDATMAASVNNGLVAPGIWTSNGFGQLKRGDTLDKGYYIFTPPIATQADADRAARKSVPFQVAAKLAGAIQSVNILVNVNR